MNLRVEGLQTHMDPRLKQIRPFRGWETNGCANPGMVRMWVGFGTIPVRSEGMSTEKMVRSELNRLMKVRIRVIGAPSPATAAERKEWDLEKDGWAMVEFHRFETERNRVSDLTGSRVRISDSRSWGMDTGRVLSCSSSIVVSC
ncbi:hypothetical protein R6Q57_013404, partial [Mikania cordata]